METKGSLHLLPQWDAQEQDNRTRSPRPAEIEPGFARSRQAPSTLKSTSARSLTLFTVYWRVGERPYRKLFANLKKSEEFAKAQPEQLAAGQVHAPSISVTEAQTFREAQRRLGPIDAMPTQRTPDRLSRALSLSLLR